MSIKVMTKAWETDCKGNELLVLISLADSASDEGYCWPSWNTIMKKTKVSKGTLSTILKSLENKNLIQRFSRKRENGSDSSNGYFVIENIGQSSEVEHHPKVQKLNTQSSEVEHLEPSVLTVSIKINKKETSLLQDFRKSFKSEIRVSDETLVDFIRYRKEIKKEIKTARPLKLFINALIECVKAGYNKHEVVGLMKNKEWQTLNIDWVKKTLGDKNKDNAPWSNHGTDYDDSKEWK